MRVSSFLPRRRTLRHEGKDFAIQEASVGAVCLFLELYEAEVTALAAAYELRPEAVSVETATSVFPLDARAVEVLHACVETAEPAEDWPLGLLRDAVLRLSDLEAIIGRLDVPEIARAGRGEGGDGEAGPGPSEWELAIVGLAHDFGCLPEQVMRMPFRSFWQAVECMGALRPQPVAPSEARPYRPGRPPRRGRSELSKLLNFPGIGFRDARGKPEA